MMLLQVLTGGPHTSTILLKNQGACGSCWAFSAVAALEGLYAKENSDIKSFAEQQLLDCDINWDNGCDGGVMENAFFYTMEDGIMEDKDYPYQAERNYTCKKDTSKFL